MRKNYFPTIEDLPSEEWRPVLGYPGYYVSNMGRVVSTRTCGGEIARGEAHLLKPQQRPHAMPCVTLCIFSSRRSYSIAELVLTAFRAPRPYGSVPKHCNRNWNDNCLENLYWDIPYGMKLTQEDVRAIRQHYLTSDEPYVNVAARYGVNRNTIRDIVTRKSWKNI